MIAFFKNRTFFDSDFFHKFVTKLIKRALTKQL